MEDFQGLVLIFVFVWIGYFFWISLYSAIIITGILGWKRNKNKGFILILIHGCIRLLHHLPSIYFKGFYAARRLPPEEYGKLSMYLVYIDNAVNLATSLLLVIGLMFLVFKKLQENADIGGNSFTQ